MNRIRSLLALLLSAAAPGALRAANSIDTAAEGLRPKLIEQRRDFHMHPELSNREERTARVVAERLRQIGFTEIRTGVARHGVVALLKGGKPGPVVAVRADMDALPINETLDVPYKSKNPGVKHACGHDVHTAVALGVAELLFAQRDQISGSVKFLFQPAEEGPPPGEEGGAPLMIKEGALDNPRPAAIFGLHAAGNIEVGSIGYSSGPAMASSDRMQIDIHGKMAHGAWPHEGIDSIVVAAEAISALQTIRSRKITTLEPLVVTIGKIEGGNRHNIIAPHVRMDGTFRTLNEDYRAQVPNMIRKILGGVTSAHDARYEFTLLDGNPVTYNDPALVDRTLPTMKRVVGAERVLQTKPVMGAEDFSYYQKIVPGFFFWLGVANKARGITAMIHTPEFDADEECLVVGVKVMSHVVMDFLHHAAAQK